MATHLKSIASPGRTARRLPSMTERQLDAYLSCRETLRRLRDASRSAAQAASGRPPGQS